MQLADAALNLSSRGRDDVFRQRILRHRFPPTAGEPAHSKLHFTRHGISQIHERRTVSRAVVKLPWNFDRNYPPPPPALFAPYAPRRRYFPAVLFRSFRADPTRFIPMKLSTPSRDIRFRPARASGCILNPYSTGIFASLSNGHFITAILLGTCITYGGVDTLCSAEIGA